MDTLPAVLAAFLGEERANKFRQPDLETLVNNRITGKIDLEDVSRKTLKGIGLGGILIDHILTAQKGHLLPTPSFLLHAGLSHGKRADVLILQARFHGEAPHILLNNI